MFFVCFVSFDIASRSKNLLDIVVDISVGCAFQDVSCNRLACLPPEIGDLQQLRVLNVRENLLTDLPYGSFLIDACREMSKFRKLI